MAKNKTSKNLQAERLVQIYSSSFYMSHFANRKLSANELGADLHKIFGTYEALLEESLKEFDGYSYKDVSEKRFADRYSTISKKLEKLVGHLSIPKPIRNSTKNDNESYYLDEDFEAQSKSAIVEKWFNKYLSIYGRTCYKFESYDLEKNLN